MDIFFQKSKPTYYVLPPSIIGSCIAPVVKPQYCGFTAGGSMVLPLEGVSRVAVILRFYRWREHLLLRGCLCLPSLGLATSIWGSWCRCSSRLPGACWRVWGAGLGLWLAGWLGAGCCYTCTCCPSSASGQPHQPGLGAGTGPGVSPRDSRRIT